MEIVTVQFEYCKYTILDLYDLKIWSFDVTNTALVNVWLVLQINTFLIWLVLIDKNINAYRILIPTTQKDMYLTRKKI